MVGVGNPKTGGMLRYLFWLFLWLLAIAVGFTPASPQSPVVKDDLSIYPWLYLRGGEPPTPQEQLIELIMVGDLMLGRGVSSRDGLFNQVSSWLTNADILAGNLEGVTGSNKEILSILTEKFESQGASLAPEQNSREGIDKAVLLQPLHLFAPPGSVAILQAAGFDILGLANNHSLDWGGEVLESSGLKLRSAGIGIVGVGTSREVANQAVMREIRGLRIAFLAFTVKPPLLSQSDSGWKVAVWDSISSMEVVRSAHLQNDFVVVMIHWGEEYSLRVDESQREIAHQLVQAGADLVIGHHPHVVQQVELVGQPLVLKNIEECTRLIAYSLGNFVFDQYAPETRPGLALRVFLDLHGLRAVQGIPIWSAPEPQLIAPEDATQLLKRVMPEPGRVAFTCDHDNCELVSDDNIKTRTLDSGEAIPWSGQIDLTGDGVLEIIRRQGESLVIYEDKLVTWRSPEEWAVLDFALGDPNDDGRAEIFVVLNKPDSYGIQQSHPFILGHRGGNYRLMWGGSAVAQPIREVELGDLDGDGLQEIVVIEDQNDGRQTLSVWRWHGWGFGLIWRSIPARWQDLRLLRDGNRLYLEAGLVER